MLVNPSAAVQLTFSHKPLSPQWMQQRFRAALCEAHGGLEVLLQAGDLDTYAFTYLQEVTEYVASLLNDQHGPERSSLDEVVQTLRWMAIHSPTSPDAAFSHLRAILALVEAAREYLGG